MSAEPFHHGAREAIAICVLAARGEARILRGIRVMSEDIGDGIDQHLSGKPDAGITAGDGARCCEIAARAVAGDSEAIGIAAELLDAVSDVADRGKRVLE